MDYALKFKQACDNLIANCEKRIGKPLTESQKQGIYNTGSWMFFEVVENEFRWCKTDEQVDAWLADIDGFKRE